MPGGAVGIIERAARERIATHSDHDGRGRRRTGLFRTPWRLVTVISALAAALSGCISSNLPLFPRAAGLIDQEIAGAYTVQGFLTKTPEDFDVFAKGNEYLIVAQGKLAFVATIHQWNNETRIMQIRPVGKTEYFYNLLRRTETGFQLNAIPCQDPHQWVGCTIKNRDELDQWARAAESNFNGPELQTATRRR
jgi:hypothetical protein